MERILASDLPWQLKMLALLAPGLAISVALLAIPQRAYVFIGKRFTWWSPTVTTGLRFSLYWIGLFSYFMFSVFWGFQGVVTGCVGDVIDGRQARIYAQHGIYRTARELAWGELVDPIADKGTAPPTLVYFGYAHAANLWLTIAILAVDVLGTAVRHANDIGAALSKCGKYGRRIGAWLIAKHETHTRTEKATSVGKIKALMQCLTLIACVPTHQGWIRDLRFVDGMCSFTIALGVFSIVSRMNVHPILDRTVDWITAKFFSHIDFRLAWRAIWHKA